MQAANHTKFFVKKKGEFGTTGRKIKHNNRLNPKRSEGLQAKPNTTKRGNAANSSLAHLRASSRIKGTKATGWSAALLCTRRFLSFHNDQTTRRAKESNPLR
jgi:hypothetical protein